MKVKKFLNHVIQDTLNPIRDRRHEYEQNIPEVYKILFDGSDKTRKIASETLAKVKKAMGLDYRNDLDFINSQCAKYCSSSINLEEGKN